MLQHYNCILLLLGIKNMVLDGMQARQELLVISKQKP